MDEPRSDLMSDLHISPKAVLVGLFVGGFALPVGAELFGYPQQDLVRVILCFLALTTLAALGWLLTDRRPVLGRWFTAAALVASIELTGLWLRIPGSLAWAVIPVAVAVPLGGPVIGLPVAAAESALAVARMAWPAAGTDGMQVVLRVNHNLPVFFAAAATSTSAALVKSCDRPPQAGPALGHRVDDRQGHAQPHGILRHGADPAQEGKQPLGFRVAT